MSKEFNSILEKLEARKALKFESPDWVSAKELQCLIDELDKILSNDNILPFKKREAPAPVFNKPRV